MTTTIRHKTLLNNARRIVAKTGEAGWRLFFIHLFRQAFVDNPYPIYLVHLTSKSNTHE